MDFLLEAETVSSKLAVMAFAITLFVLVMGAILIAVDRPKRIPQWAVSFGFLGPMLLMLTFGLVYPALRTVYESMRDSEAGEFIGLANYVIILTEPGFQVVLINTVLWVFLVPIGSTCIGLVYAVLVDQTRFESVAKALVFLPMAISMVGASIIWKFVYEFRPTGANQIGLANQILVWLGFDSYQFILTPPWNTLFLIVVMIWIEAGFAMVILSAAIKAIPDDIVESARMDGAGGVRMFLHITAPSIRPAVIVVLTAIAIGTLKIFDIVRTMTGGNFETSVVANEFYTQSFTQFNVGVGAALAVLLFVLVVPIVMYNARQLRLSRDAL